ncbi:MAG: hypothetical protein AABX96_00585 [Nanoarchaeota archaeon]
MSRNFIHVLVLVFLFVVVFQFIYSIYFNLSSFSPVSPPTQLTCKGGGNDAKEETFIVPRSEAQVEGTYIKIEDPSINLARTALFDPITRQMILSSQFEEEAKKKAKQACKESLISTGVSSSGITKPGEFFDSYSCDVAQQGCVSRQGTGCEKYSGIKDELDLKVNDNGCKDIENKFKKVITLNTRSGGGGKEIDATLIPFICSCSTDGGKIKLFVGCEVCKPQIV